ncbi:MAG: YkgJ family cysteine cluster protein [Polyangiaceae bacterium]
MSAAFPSRPRLAEHALVRRHFIDGNEIVVVHDARSGDLVRMPPRAWALIEAADGTRDLAGLLLAASQRGELRRASEVEAVLTDLHAAGLLVDGIDPFAFEAADAEVPADAPLDVLPFALTCDGSGACCATYSTVRFTEDEAARARSLLPLVEEGRARVFLPLAGSGAQPSRAVTMIDGRCAYLAGDGACELHRRHGAGAKPSGCAIYPATFAFDGEAVRVSLGVECACVAKSLGNKDGEPLVPAAARSRADLPAGAQIAVLPERIDLGEGLSRPRAEVLAWSRDVLAAWREAARGEETADAFATLWNLAKTVRAGVLSASAVEAALQAAKSRVPVSELKPWISALIERTSGKRDAADRWRAHDDRVRGLSASLAEAAAALGDEACLSRAVEGEGAARPLESFYLTATVHGHGLIGDVPLATALCDRAVRVLLGRALSTRSEPSDGAALTRVEAMMRAQGLKEYARGVG